LKSILKKEEEFARFQDDVSLLCQHFPQLESWMLRHPEPRTPLGEDAYVAFAKESYLFFTRNFAPYGDV
jgi:hypothetical protein